MARELAEQRLESVAAARFEASSGTWPALVVVAAEAPSAEDAGVLARVEDPQRHGIALVTTGGPAQAHWRLRAATDGSLEVPVLGRSVRAQRVARSQLAGIAALLCLAAEAPDVAADAAPYDRLAPAAPTSPLQSPAEPADPVRAGEEQPQAASAPPRIGERPDHKTPTLFADPPFQAGELEPAVETVAASTRPAQVEVAVLGPLHISGLTLRPKRRKVAELIAWLALHSSGGKPEEVAAALSHAGELSDHTFRTYRWEARRALGESVSSGEPLLMEYGSLRLGPEVTTDWGRFRALAERSDSAARREALGLVRGRPLSDCDWPWATAEGIVAAIESEIADVAAALGEEDLERGEHQSALHAVEKGLLANPYDERLYRLAMRAHHASGNPAGVRATMARLSAVLESEIEPVESLHPETQALYASLTSRRDDRNGPSEHAAERGALLARRQR